MATATATQQTAITHRIGCPVSLHPEDEALAVRVETYRATRPARKYMEDGVEFVKPAERLRVFHCVECGELTYTPEG